MGSTVPIRIDTNAAAPMAYVAGRCEIPSALLGLRLSAAAIERPASTAIETTHGASTSGCSRATAAAAAPQAASPTTGSHEKTSDVVRCTATRKREEGACASG